MPIAFLVLLSSIQMEACGGKGLFGLPFATWMYLHCILGILMFILVIEHLYLHFGKRNWLTKVKGLKRQTKWLCTIFAILLAISVVAFVRIIVLTAHSPIGAITKFALAQIEKGLFFFGKHVNFEQHDVYETAAELGKKGNFCSVVSIMDFVRMRLYSMNVDVTINQPAHLLLGYPRQINAKDDTIEWIKTCTTEFAL